MKTASCLRWLGMILASLLLCACPGKDPGSDPGTNPYFRVELLDLDSGAEMPSVPDELVFPNDLHELFEVGIPVRVSTNLEAGQWSITTTEPDWCRITDHYYRINGKEEYFYFIDCAPYVFQYSAEQNPAPRTCEVRIQAGELYDKTIRVVQQGKIYFVLPYQKEGESVEISPAGGSEDIIVLSNAHKWGAASNAGWVTVSTPDGNTLKISAAARPETENGKRTAVVTLHDMSTIASARTTLTINITDADATLGGDDYNYGDHIDWN